jgi:hypothetical protein
MSARKLGRLAGLVFVLAAILGGTGSAALGAQHAASEEAVQVTTQVVDWT